MPVAGFAVDEMSGKSCTQGALDCLAVKSRRLHECADVFEDRFPGLKFALKRLACFFRMSKDLEFCVS